MTTPSLEHSVSTFGKSVTSKLSNPAISGAPEDQLRGPLETLLAELSVLAGHAVGAVSLIGETSLSEDHIRPDYAVTVRNALVGFIEVKAPGKGANPRLFRDRHDKSQWERLKSLPNLLYTDGNSFSLWRDGERVGDVVRLVGDVESSGEHLAAPLALVALVGDFLGWQPQPPRNPKRLAEISARLCRLLREEVGEQMREGNTSLTGLAEDWRRLLFPDATDESFADGYAQAVTFGLLIARARDISLKGGIDHAASVLRRSNSLIGTALRLLTENVDNLKALETSLGTMTRVFEEVHWSVLSKGDPDAWLYFYEHFLEVYDNTLRKRTGSYYTPPEVVNAMVRLVDEALRGPLFNRPQGLAAEDVTIADPAVGTGTFLLGVLRRIARTIGDDLGPGSVPGALEAAAERLIGFELQFGPYAVAQLRLLAEYGELMDEAGASGDLPEMKLFITDTLGNPFVEDEYIPSVMQPVAQSRRAANQIKKTEKITVVIGNPPYKEKAEGRGGWIEKGSSLPGSKDIQAPLDRWRPPPEWGVGAHAKHLKNLYVYFWRWASLKVFGAGWRDATGLPDADEEGIVCFITVAGFLNGPGFQKMRADLRASCSDIWIIDCSPEGHQPEVATRIFQGVQQPVCIVLAAKRKGKNPTKPANVYFRPLPEGRRDEKFTALAGFSLADAEWVSGPNDWRGAFLPEAVGQWAGFPPLRSLFDYNGSGVMPGRTWVIAPDRESLERRWKRLIGESDAQEKERLFHPHEGGDRTTIKIPSKGLPQHEFRPVAIASDKGSVIESARCSFRSFDRQWIIPDYRLINRPNPTLWASASSNQVYVTALERVSPTNGPAISLTASIPDLDHYHGRGGRVFPLWADADAAHPNVSATVLAHLSETYGRDVSAPDLMAYIAAVLAHPAFTAHFAMDLKQPGLRVPMTADAELFTQTVALGREVIWLHTYGERFDDVAAGRPKQAPRLPKASAPLIPAGGTIPGAPEPLPEDIDYDPATRTLRVGKGRIENVMPEIWAYEVSGKQVVKQWFSYRRRDRSRPVIGDRRPPSPLDSIQPDHWLNEYTTDLMNLLHVLGRLVLLEPMQKQLLDQILEQPLLSLADLGLATDNGSESDEDGEDVPA